MRYVKQIIAVIIFIFSLQALSAQSNYIVHTLKQGESLSMLAEQYHTSVGDIMRINGMHAESKLVYGAKIKIPSTKAQADAVKKGSNAVVKTSPVTKPANEITHVVTKGETLYSISKKYNINVEQIKTWNHLTDDNVKLGTLLIISDNGSDKFATTQTQNQRVETNTVTQPTEQTLVVNTPDKQPDENINSKASTQQDTKTQPLPQTQADINSQQQASDYSGEGYFASQFKERKSKNMQHVSGISKIFKTASGWTDGKYYILANDIEPGTIVKITADNGSAVYAKVLWNMGDLKENTGINFRVSNATAAALHVNESSFNVRVSF